jgi:hypothetical protein
MSNQVLIDEALQILADLGLPPAQRNERSALTLLALVDLQPSGKWASVKSPLMGVTPIMEWIAEHYGKKYAPNTRETIRRQTLHQFVDANIALYNPDDPLRSVNSPEFAPRFAPGSDLVYAGDTGEKMGLFDKELLKSLDVVVDQHGKMPDVVLYWKERGWLLLIESVTSPWPGRQQAP